MDKSTPLVSKLKTNLHSNFTGSLSGHQNQEITKASLEEKYRKQVEEYFKECFKIEVDIDPNGNPLIRPLNGFTNAVLQLIKLSK